jgi:deoxyxylulose-5-phosphate synthase
MTIASRIHELDPTVAVDVLGLPRKFIAQGRVDELIAQHGLDAQGIVSAARGMLGRAT